jgi:zinc protease
LREPPVHHEILSNGVELLLLETHVAPVAAVQVWVRVGSADERPGEEGLAHFHEHMLFKGTERRGVGDVAAEIEGAGGRVNAYTSLDLTVYHATLPSAEMAVAVDVLSDAVLRPRFDPDEIAREREVVLEEIRRAQDSPGRVLNDAVFARAWSVHPYRAPILGTPESVAAFDRERVSAFFRRWYAAENLLVVAAGDFEAPRARDAFAAAFAGARSGAARRARPIEPEPEGPRGVVLRRPFERASVELAWLSVGLAHPDTPHLDLLALVLGQGDSSRLVRRVKERDALADSADAWSYTPLDPGVFGASLETDPERSEEALEAVAAEVERLRREPVGSDELEKARANFLAMEHFERESVGGLARKLGSFHALAGDWRSERAYFEAIRRATPDDLLGVARRWLGPERLAVGVLLPQDGDVALDARALAAAVARGAGRTARAFSAPVRTRDAAEIASWRLPCGAALHVAPRRDLPVVAARAAFLGGQLAESEADAGITSFTTSMWLRGTHGRSAADFARAVESLAADVDGFAGRSSLGATFECTTDKLGAVLELFAELLLEPAFAPDELERERRETLAGIARREDQLAERAFLLFQEHLFRRHPYRLALDGSEESVKRFTAEQLAAHHARLVRAENLVVGVAGDVDPEGVASLFGARLADLPCGGFERPAPPDEPPPDEIRVAELRKPRAQAHLVLGFRGLALDDPDRFALETLGQVLSGQSGRLFLELRDRRSLAYSVTAMNVEGVAPGWFAVYIGTAPEKLDQARAGMLSELERLVQEPPSAAELDGAKRHLIGTFAIDRQRSAVRAAHLSLDALYGLGPDASRHYSERIQAVSADDALRVARRVIRLDAYTLAVIRP